MQATEEQLAIVAAAETTEENLLVSALAGAAKTTTLVMIAKALPKKSILCLAFNKAIAVEMKERLPINCEAKTLNSLGNAVWKDVLGKWPQIKPDKTYTIVSEMIEELDEEWKPRAFARMADIIKAIDGAKTAGYVPDEYPKTNTALMGDDDMYAWLDEEPEEWEMAFIMEAYTRSLNLAFNGVLDFNDQILMPTVFFAPFPRYPVTLVDEAQDLSALNHQMLRKLVGKRRLIAVGDENQAIYGFRGAHADSMALLKHEFNMRELRLSISFRCPQSVVRSAWWKVPFMRWPEWAKEGKVEKLYDWTEKDLDEQAVVICRNNAPIFSLAIKLLKNGRYPQIVGSDIGKALVKIMKKFGRVTMSKADAIVKLDEWVQTKLLKARDKGKIHDQADCIRVFLHQGKTLGDAIAYAEHIFNMAGPIKMMTGHKAKGLEFDHVYFLDEHLLGDKGQDLNLRYVIQTRTKETLTYITLEGFEDNDPEGM